jgi:prepilin-type N-terminal cleavage/methylation domain-containing protein
MTRQELIKKFKSLKIDQIKSIQDAELRNKALALRKKQGGFTLLELLVVVVIIAVLAGAIVGRFDGLTEKATEAQGAHTMQALDSAFRAFFTQRKQYPNNLDNLAAADGAALASLDEGALEGLGAFTIPNDAVGAAIVESLEEVGITQVRTLTAVQNGLIQADPTLPLNPEIPNWVFNDEDAGGIEGGGNVASLEIANAADADHTNVLSAIATAPTDDTCAIDNFSDDEAVDPGLITQHTGLLRTECHLVIALGVGNNSQLEAAGESIGVAHVPTDTDVARGRYGRYIALFHVASEANEAAGFQEADVFEKARFVGITDAKMEPYQDELAEGSGG